jgi:hypothetical protein
MTTFQLTKDSETFDFDVAGPVSQNGNPIGTWTTDQNNQIVVTKTDGSQDSFEVTWKFDENNQLGIWTGDTLVFNFHSVPGNKPLYSTVNAVLNFRPDRNKTFGFSLRGEWNLNDGHDLTFTINGVGSVIDGFIQDPRSRFMYYFFNKQDLTQMSILGFVGSWQQSVDANGVPRMNFSYKREDGSTDTFSLPGGITIDKTINQFMYSYNKDGHSYRIQFVGLLQVSENFQITYSIDRQVSKAGEEQVAATTFTLDAVFSKNNFSGDVELVVTKPDGTAGGTTITIGGSFTALLGATKLQVGFQFSQVRGPNTVTSTFAFSGSLQMSNGQVQWQFVTNAQTTTITISAADIKLGDARVDARLNIVGQGGKLVGVYALFGIAF